jgi:hypothetical protein
MKSPPDIPPEEKVISDQSFLAAVPMEEERARATPPQDEALKVALLPSDEPQKTIAPKGETAPKTKPEREKHKDVLIGLLGPSKEREKSPGCDSSHLYGSKLLDKAYPLILRRIALNRTHGRM